MLPPFIIEQIRRREEQERKQYEQRQEVAAGEAATDQAQGIVHELEGNGVHAAAFK